MQGPARPHLDHRVALPGTEARLWSHGAGHYQAPRGAHASVELAWVERGSVSYRVGTREVVIGAGEAFLVPRGVEHATTFGEPAVAGALELSTDMLAELSDSLGRGALPAEAGKVVVSERLFTLAQLVRAELAAQEAGHLMSVAALTEAMTILVLRGASAATRSITSRDRRVSAVLELIHTQYAEPISIEDLARAAGTSRFHMSRLFRDSIGQSPYQYLLRTRIERAAELLRGGKQSVTEVAFAVGFGDLGRFARMFRAFTGKSPASYAKNRCSRETRPSIPGPVLRHAPRS
jgi:AraC-like DNA-binding protein